MVVIGAISSIYTLRKSKKILRHLLRLYRKKQKSLDPAVKEKILSHIKTLQSAIAQKDAVMAERVSSILQEKASVWMPTKFLHRLKDSVLSLLLALLVAVGIRTMWFDNYSIPTGSMRPTLKEGDFLFVSKASYGLNVPLQPAHFYFDPSLVQRGDVFVFSGKNMNIEDVDTNYFYLFPGKKQFVKRIMGKPGDTLYFYGGKIYGIDARGQDLKELREADWASSLEHIPFIRFEGKVERTSPFSTTLYQMGLPVAKLSSSYLGKTFGELLPIQGKEKRERYSDLWGMDNFAMARIVSKEQASRLHPEATKELPDASWYLELTHHPSIHNATALQNRLGGIYHLLGANVSFLPLTDAHLQAISSHMTTCRFIVHQGIAHRLGYTPQSASFYKRLPSLPKVPDGTYEIQNGVAYSIGLGNIASVLPKEHPLYTKDPNQIQLLYNLGIEFLNDYDPAAGHSFAPSRYAYFKHHDLYLLGHPIINKEDPGLIVFLQKEYQKQSQSPQTAPYFAFDDAGPPFLPDGTLDTALIKGRGITIPENMYLALGDNHAMSSDSRIFGFVPEDNLRGQVRFLFWPPQGRMGALSQPHHHYLTFPNLFILSVITLFSTLYFIYQKRNSESL